MKRILFPILLAGLIVGITYSVVMAALAGDIDGNGKVDLDDVRSGLMVLCAFDATDAPVARVSNNPEIDVNDDDRYGTEDSTYILQEARNLTRVEKQFPTSAFLLSSALLGVLPFMRKKEDEDASE
jgi:hypothetical protein